MCQWLIAILAIDYTSLLSYAVYRLAAYKCIIINRYVVSII